MHLNPHNNFHMAMLSINIFIYKLNMNLLYSLLLDQMEYTLSSILELINIQI